LRRVLRRRCQVGQRSLHPDETIPENALDDAIVASEVNTFDAATHTGWIVHVIGPVHRAERTTNSGNCAHRKVHLVAKVITGQRVRVDP